ncbi:MAG: hypothetical protein ACRCY7_00060 [Cetobacterium sp.]|uniref:hypothetical protein n=1 Tax=Cetobacterium sp. TaxID=2071632 RepID=UPI003F39B61A
MNTRIYILHDSENFYFNKITEQEKESFLLSCDEVDSFQLISNQEIEDNKAKKVAENNLKISGIIYGDLTQSINDRLNLKKLSDKLWTIQELDNVWGQVPEKYLNQVKDLINKTYSNINFDKDKKTDNVVQLNRENINKLFSWRFSKEKGYKRTVVVEVIGAKGNSLYIFENMEISDFQEEGDSSSGNGSFEILLKKSLIGSQNYSFFISKEKLPGISL